MYLDKAELRFELSNRPSALSLKIQSETWVDMSHQNANLCGSHSLQDFELMDFLSSYLQNLHLVDYSGSV